MDWTALRDDFPILSRCTYLNSCSLGALSAYAMDGQRRFQEHWNARGAASWYDHWLDELADWRRNIARLLGCDAVEVAWAPSVSAALGSLASALARRDDGRDEVVAYAQEFPTAAAAFSQRPGTTLRHVQSPDGVQVPTGAYAEALGKRTRALLTSRVFYNSGTVQDVAALNHLARRAGAFHIVDDYQGTGQLVADVRAWGADAVVGGSLKWLCGGMATCFLYVRRDRTRELEPQHSGWWANAGMFDFDNTAFRYWDDARRFEAGEVNMGALYAANAVLRELLRIGMDRIEARDRELATDLLDRLDDAGFGVRVHDRSTHSALLMVETPDPAGVVKRLEVDGVIVDHRPGAVRASPHFYNTMEENQIFVESLQRAVDGA